MRRLMLLRHAKTESQAASGRDVDRALDARGVSDVAEIGQWLASQSDLPTRVLVSPAVRARQTWQGIVDVLPRTLESVEVDSLYNATPTELMHAIRDHGDGATCLMVVAHNPGLHELALALSGGGDRDARRALEDNLPTGALVTIAFDVDSWDDAGFQRGQLTGFVSPKTLKAMNP